jgi:hypothetical protein
MTNPADTHIANLIKILTDKASKFTCTPSDRQNYIDQISQLRASMNPVIVQKVKKD